MTAPVPPVDLDQLAATLAGKNLPWHVDELDAHRVADRGGAGVCWPGLAADAAAIVAAVNPAPDLIAELRDLRAKVAAVEALHVRAHPDGPTSCVECNKGRKFVPWPCDTARALGSGS